MSAPSEAAKTLAEAWGRLQSQLTPQQSAIAEAVVKWSDEFHSLALAHVAQFIRLSDDNPDLARGGSVAAFLEQLAYEAERE